jgi:hypothetical protein
LAQQVTTWSLQKAEMAEANAKASIRKRARPSMMLDRELKRLEITLKY